MLNNCERHRLGMLLNFEGNGYQKVMRLMRFQQQARSYEDIIRLLIHVRKTQDLNVEALTQCSLDKSLFKSNLKEAIRLQYGESSSESVY